jgi:2-keto-4-pentenoate hydratase/2-oxohepta-3-ene-1,7-dioic acid hydratase in catechol pathway
MIRNIWAVGRNYSEHAKELGNELPTEPLIFLKAGSCASFAADIIQIPPGKSELHHEVELALELNEKLQISKAGIALDLTDREKQNLLKAKGQPWTLAKSFKGACPLSSFFEINDPKGLQKMEITISVNGVIKQQGNTSQMIFSIESLTHFILENFPVQPGDLILTGTPSGVGPLKRGDHVEAELRGKIKHSWLVE